ncbi:MAG: NAD-binding protein [Asticcacaulis sp.]
MMSQGVSVTVLEKNPDQVEAVGRFGFKAYFGDATRLDLLRSSGAEGARMLVVAVDDADAAIDIVKLAKQHFPKLKVYARARNRRHAFDLNRAGVDYYHRETLDSALQLARDAVVALGRPARRCRRATGQVPHPRHRHAAEVVRLFRERARHDQLHQAEPRGTGRHIEQRQAGRSIAGGLTPVFVDISQNDRRTAAGTWQIRRMMPSLMASMSWMLDKIFRPVRYPVARGVAGADNPPAIQVFLVRVFWSGFF